MPDRLIIRARLKNAATDSALFDKSGNFIGSVSEVIGSGASMRYVVKTNEDFTQSRRTNLKTGDSIFYFNCDRIDQPRGIEPRDEPSLLEQKQMHKQEGKHISKMIMSKVIDNIRTMSIRENVEIDEEMVQNFDVQSKLALRSNSINSKIFRAYQSPEALEKLQENIQRKRYKKSKTKISAQQSDLRPTEIPQFESPNRPDQYQNAMENELDESYLGKRNPQDQANHGRKKRRRGEATTKIRLSPGSSMISHISESSNNIGQNPKLMSDVGQELGMDNENDEWLHLSKMDDELMNWTGAMNHKTTPTSVRAISTKDLGETHRYSCNK